MNCKVAKCYVLAAIAYGVSAVSLEAADWGQWRGPNRDGKSSETGLLAKWPDAGPKLVWQVKDLGDGYSTPSVVGDRLFVMRNKGLENEDVVCLSVSNGQQLWSQRVGKVGPNEMANYPAARSTPTVVGNVLYALGSDGDLACLETAAGKVVWTKSLRTDFGGKPGSWAYAESPLVDGDVVICSPGGSQSTVVALNKRTGAIVWKTPLADGDDAGFSSPIITNVGGVKQYVLYLAKGVVGIKADTGDVLWRYMKTADANANIQTPVASGNFVYTAAERVGGGLIQVASDKSQPIEKYFSKGTPNGMGGCVLIDGLLYGSQGSVFVCADFLTGETKWQDRVIGAPASVCAADGKLYTHNDNNEVAMIAASPRGFQLLGKFLPPNTPETRANNGKAWAHPIISNGKLYIRDVGNIWCYDIKG